MLSCARDQRLDQNSTQLTSRLEKKNLEISFALWKTSAPFYPEDLLIQCLSQPFAFMNHEFHVDFMFASVVPVTFRVFLSH